MTIAVLRRFSRTVAMQVTSAGPSTLAPPVIATSPQTPAVPAPRPDRPPTYTAGLCWHKVHVHLDGDRYGVSPAGAKPYQHGAITPCEHLSRTGR